MKNKKLAVFVSLVMCFFIVSILAGCGGNNPAPAKSQDAGKKIVVKLAHGNAADAKDPYHAMALKFKEILEKKNPKVKVEIYPGGQLGAEDRAFQDVQNGIIHGAVLKHKFQHGPVSFL